MHPGYFAAHTPQAKAVILASTESTLTYEALDTASRDLAQALINYGLEPGDRFAVFMSNCLEFVVAIWAGLRAGLRVVPINRSLTVADIGYILTHSDTRILICTPDLSKIAVQLPNMAPGVERFLMVRDCCPGYESLEAFMTGNTRVEPAGFGQKLGGFICYTSGSTGRPKGVIRPLPDQAVENGYIDPSFIMFGCRRNSKMLVTTPLSNAGSITVSMVPFVSGGSLVISDRFDPIETLQFIERYRITHAYLLPTMFRMMLQIPKEKRAQFDLSSLEWVIHMAEPCPRGVKQQMIDWLGPIFYESYGASEFRELTWISTPEWLSRPASVGRPFGFRIHILDEALRECVAGEVGQVHVESPSARRFRYHKDDEATEACHTKDGWYATGDIGYVDAEGYLYLVDRKHFMIICAGANVYPREVENVLSQHQGVAEAAVFGLPDPIFGEKIIAVIVARNTVASSADLKSELRVLCLERLPRIKCPAQIYIEPSLPRLPSGKVSKRALREQYLANETSDVSGPDGPAIDVR